MIKLMLQKGRLVIFLVIIMLINTQNTVLASNSIESQDPRYVVDVPYTYPILPGTDEWKEFDTHVEKIDACQIPEEILQNMTTEALLKTVLKYPLMEDMMVYDSPNMGYNALYSTFNGLQTLVQRTDAAFELEKLNNSGNETFSLTENGDTLKSIYLNVLTNYISEQDAYSENNRNARSSPISIQTPKGSTFYAEYNRTWDDVG